MRRPSSQVGNDNPISKGRRVFRIVLLALSSPDDGGFVVGVGRGDIIVPRRAARGILDESSLATALRSSAGKLGGYVNERSRT